MHLVLNLPNNYVEIEEEEMMYLDGGVYSVYEGWGSWYVHFTKSDCHTIAKVTTTSALAVSALSSILIKCGAAQYGAIAKIARGVLTIIAAQFWSGYWNKGLRLYFKAWTIPNWYRIIK